MLEVHLCEAALLDGAHVRAEAGIRGRQAAALPLCQLVQRGRPLREHEPASCRVLSHGPHLPSQPSSSGCSSLAKSALFWDTTEPMLAATVTCLLLQTGWRLKRTSTFFDHPEGNLDCWGV